MATYYVGSGGNDGNNGTTWALRKLTLNGAEDIPVAANDTVYVGPGTYRELLTVDVSGAAGQPITYIGDYTGANTDGVGGVVRITGSDNDTSATRAQCINAAAARNYRTLRGFTMDMTTGALVNWADGSNLTIDECYFHRPLVVATQCLYIQGANQANHTISNCVFDLPATNTGGCGAVFLSHSSALDAVGHNITNCVFHGGRDVFLVYRLGGVTVKNSTFIRGGVNICLGLVVIPSAGQTMSVRNCQFMGIYGVAMYEAADVGDWIVEDYNSFAGCATDRSNVAVGANSITTPFLPDTRWFHEATNGGRFVTPFDMASYCELVEVTDSSATSTDMRGSSMVGSEREIGALEYDATLLVESAAGGGRRPRIRWHGV